MALSVSTVDYIKRFPVQKRVEMQRYIHIHKRIGKNSLIKYGKSYDVVL